MTIWFDFTTTLRNTGRNGIAAAEWNLGSAVLAAEPATRCFALNERRGLVEIDPGHDLRRAFYASPTAVAATTVRRATPTWRNHIRVALVSALGGFADPVLRVLAGARALPRRVSSTVSRTTNRALVSANRHPLAKRVQPDDVVISLGADWSGELLVRLLDLKRRTGCRVVSMVYDLIPLTHTHLAFHKDPELFAAYYARLTEVSDLICCISEQSRQDLARAAAEHGWPLPPTAVLRLGEELPDAAEETGARDDFYVWVGTVERRKNLELVYDALRIIESEGDRVPEVVVAGAIGWGVDDLIAEIDLQSTAASRAIVLLGSVDEATLDRLYRRGRALLFPSFYEGWGLPVREAAVRGCPVAAGDSPAVREAVAGYAGAVLLPVDDPGPWADYLRREPSRPADPATVHTWSAAAVQLMGHVTEIA